jgi:hypothetical protein
MTGRRRDSCRRQVDRVPFRFSPRRKLPVIVWLINWSRSSWRWRHVQARLLSYILSSSASGSELWIDDGKQIKFQSKRAATQDCLHRWPCMCGDIIYSVSTKIHGNIPYFSVPFCDFLAHWLSSFEKMTSWTRLIYGRDRWVARKQGIDSSGQFVVCSPLQDHKTLLKETDYEQLRWRYFTCRDCKKFQKNDAN